MKVTAGLFVLVPLSLAANWPGFRGDGSSHTSAKNLPLSWSDRHNIAWKVKLPAFGQSTPVIWGSQIFLTAVDGPKKEKLLVYSLDVKTGKQLWLKSFPSSRPQETGDRVARAASTPAADADGLYAMFDSGDLFALTHSGEVRWTKNCNKEFTPLENGHDFGASLRQGPDRLFLLVNHFGPSYLTAFEKKSGRKLWQVDLPKEGGWNTPVLSGETLLIQRSGGVAAYNAGSGALLWEDLHGFNRDNAIPSLSVSGDIAVIPSQNKGGTWAFRLGNPKEPVWRTKAATNGYSSPLLTKDRAYFVNSVGALFAVDLKTGKDLWATRLSSTAWASGLAAGDRVYFFTGEGTSYVFRDADSMEKLGEGQLEAESTVYAVAPAGENALLIRTGFTLTKAANLGQKDPAPPAPAPVISQAPFEAPLPPAPEGKPGDVKTNPKDGLRYAWIPAGKFPQGCSVEPCGADEKPVHEVTLSRGFWLSTTEVTVAAYRKLIPDHNPGFSEPDLPVTQVSQEQAAAYCRWSGGRLPSEAEWEYAAGPHPADLSASAWFADNSGDGPLDSYKIATEQRSNYAPLLRKNNNRPRPVGGKKANAFGLYDMVGNASEWTGDWFEPYTAAPVTNPRFTEDGEKRIVRGGGWSSYPAMVTTHSRMKLGTTSSNNFIGFRCAQ